MSQTKNVEQFIKTCAWRNVMHELGMTNINDREYWADLYDAVTGDSSYDDLPPEVRDMYDYMGEVEALAVGLKEAYAVVSDTLRTFIMVDDTANLAVDLAHYYTR